MPLWLSGWLRMQIPKTARTIKLTPENKNFVTVNKEASFATVADSIG
jgi:hypothetical protein